MALTSPVRRLLLGNHAADVRRGDRQRRLDAVAGSDHGGGKNLSFWRRLAAPLGGALLAGALFILLQHVWQAPGA